VFSLIFPIMCMIVMCVVFGGIMLGVAKSRIRNYLE
jgi:hypothetical protein